MSEMQDVKRHFEWEAKVFDDIILKLIPDYQGMIDALVGSLTFDVHRDIDVIDLGCGTGTTAFNVKRRFKNAHLTCLDIAENMLEMAKAKLSVYGDTRYINSDFYTHSFDQQYDAMVSSLALHHLETDEDKTAFYKKIYSGLKSGGIFVNADIVRGENNDLQALNMREWRNFMIQNVSEKEVDEKWIPTYYKEDRPVSISKHFQMLKEAGFCIVDVVWKFYTSAVYTAVK